MLSLLFLLVSYLAMALAGKGAKRLVDFSWMNKKGKRQKLYFNLR
jgi:hypothetical protein